jgi:RNA polymerase sigma factor (sigma-70 family)
MQLLAELLKRDEHRLRRQAKRHAELPDDVDDALQSAYLLFLERYNGIGEPLAWLYTTVKREAWGIRRRASRHCECGFRRARADNGEIDLTELLPINEPGPAERYEQSESIAGQRQALMALKGDEREALWLLGLGHSYAEICQLTGWTYTKVNRCVSEGRSALRRETS